MPKNAATTMQAALTMAVDNTRFLASNSKTTGTEGQAAPSTTSDRTTSIGDWTEKQIVTCGRTHIPP